MVLCALVGALFFSDASALAAAPEAPETGGASAVTATSAKLAGVLNPHASGQEGFYYFVYAPRGAACTEYGVSVETISVGFEKEPVAPPVEVAGLEPSTLYTFCLVNRNLAGEATVGSAKMFTTLAAPPAVEGETSSGVGSTAATLEAQVNPNNQVTSCEVQYGTTTAYGTKTACEPASLNGFGDQRAALALTGLTPGSTYHFRIVAENAGKEKTEGTDQTVTTVPTPHTDPVTAVAATTATLNGHLTLDPVDTQYFFYYKVGSECAGENQTTTKDAGSGPGTLASPEEPVTGLRPATQYAVCLVTVNAFGSEQAAPVTFTTLPSSPTIENESFGDSGEKVLLNAHIIPNGGATTYQFEYGETSSYDASIPIPAGSIGSGNEPITVPAAEPTGLKTSTTYHYRVIATNQYGTTDGPDQTLLTPPIAGPSPIAGPTGLPDGRVYEEVSPAYKNGNFYGVPLSETFGLASAEGDAVLYTMTGATGTAYSGMVSEYVSRRTPQTGWQTVSAEPRPLTKELSIENSPLMITPSTDFGRFVYMSPAAAVAAEPLHEVSFGTTSSVNIFLSENAALEPTWLGEPRIPNPSPAEGDVHSGFYVVAGISPSLETVYFTYAGTLIPEDGPREPLVRAANPPGHSSVNGPWGFYEWTKGQLVSAGVLPNGTVSPYGAVPAAILDVERQAYGWEPQAWDFHNEVSEDGSRAFFVSPDPDSGSPEPPQIYVRKPSSNGGRASVLVSGSEIEGHEGQPAPDGASFSFASPDGSQAFFSSIDRLTATAPEGTEPKEYDYDVDTGSLTYLPGVSRAIAAVSRNGADLLFEVEGQIDKGQIDIWKRGANGGSVVPVAAGGGEVGVRNAHVTADGGVFVFRSEAGIPGFNNTKPESPQIYRYEMSTGELDCISCAPAGMASGEARLSYNNRERHGFITVKSNGGAGDPETTVETRGMSADGERIFFDTTSALVPQDTNGTRDVYEWENGEIYLISSGASTEESQILDSSESGDDVFFATAQGLVPGDRDDSYDIYDARVPRPGDNPPPAAVPCQGSVCQGPPSVPDLLGAPASSTFSGAGNIVVAPETKIKPKPKPKPKHKRKPAKKKKKSGKQKPRHKGKASRRSGRSRNSRVSKLSDGLRAGRGK
jgi:hypothetical protein